MRRAPVSVLTLPVALTFDFRIPVYEYSIWHLMEKLNSQFAIIGLCCYQTKRRQTCRFWVLPRTMTKTQDAVYEDWSHFYKFWNLVIAFSSNIIHGPELLYLSCNKSLDVSKSAKIILPSCCETFQWNHFVLSCVYSLRIHFQMDEIRYYFPWIVRCQKKSGHICLVLT